MKMYASRTVRRSVVAALAAATLGPLAVLAAEDFTRYSNEELVQRRSQAQDMNETDRLRYREEMQTRTQNMSAEERNRLGIGRDGAVAQGTQTRERVRTGEDNERGQGELKRERERTEQRDASGYGSGYESRQGGSGAGGGFGGGGRGGMGGGGRGGR